MKPSGSRAKGKGFEKKICEQIGEWWCQDNRAFYCNIGSGNRSTVLGSVYSGDVIPVKDVAKPWPLSIECKKSEQWSLEQFMLGVPSEPLFQYFGQCISSARNSENNIPLLICSRNHRKPFIFVPRKIIIECHKSRRAGLLIHCPYMHICTYSIPVGVKEKFGIAVIDVMTFTLESFFMMFTRQDFV
jgi:hypothetical protein